MVLPSRGGGRVGRRRLQKQMSNVQYRMSNFEIRYWMFDILTFLCGSDTRHELDTSSLRRLTDHGLIPCQPPRPHPCDASTIRAATRLDSQALHRDHALTWRSPMVAKRWGATPINLGRLALAAFVVIAACEGREETHPAEPSVTSTLQPGTSSDRMLERLPEMAPFLPSVPIDPRPPEPSDADLVAAIRRSEGRVFVGLKPASAPRTREPAKCRPSTGRRRSPRGRLSRLWESRLRGATAIAARSLPSYHRT